MEKETLYNAIVPLDPWFSIIPLDGVDANDIVNEGVTELPVDARERGKYMNFCLIIRCPEKQSLGLEFLDIVCVWSTAVEPFNFNGRDKIILVREKDIFCKVDRSSQLYNDLFNNSLALVSSKVAIK